MKDTLPEKIKVVEWALDRVKNSRQLLSYNVSFRNCKLCNTFGNPSSSYTINCNLCPLGRGKRIFENSICHDWVSTKSSKKHKELKREAKLAFEKWLEKYR